MNNLTPAYLKSRFHERERIYDTRSKDILCVHKPKTEYKKKKKGFSYHGAKLWNSLNNNTNATTATNINTFKNIINDQL